MVETDTIMFESKLKNAIKHSIGRHALIIDEVVYTPEVTTFLLRTPKNRAGETIEVPNMYSLKDAVCYVLHLPQLQQFMSITITESQDTQHSILKSFSNQTVPNTFKVCKVPKRQIQIQVGNKKSYINISLQSYQKVLSCIDKIRKWPASISCKDFMAFFKRKEFVTILLQVSQLSQ